MRRAIALLATVVVCSPALAFDTAALPQTCKDTIAQMQTEKARFGQLGAVMGKSRKAGNHDEFCRAAQETLALVVAQSGKLDYCLGDLAGDRSASDSAVSQLTQLKAVYRSMLDAAKKPENDRMKCGLAQQ